MRVAHLVGVRRAVAQVAVGAEVELPEVQRQAALVPVEVEHARRLRDDLGADAVAGEDGDELLVRHGPPLMHTARRALSTMASTIAGQAPSGRSWPMPGMTTSRAPGMAAAVAFPPATGTSGSSAPWMTTVGRAHAAEVRGAVALR